MSMTRCISLIHAHSKSYIFVLYLVFSSTIDPRKQSAGVCTYKCGAMIAVGAVEKGSEKPASAGIEEIKGKFAFTLEFSLPILIFTSHLTHK